MYLLCTFNFKKNNSVISHEVHRSRFCVKLFLANKRHYNWQPIHNNFKLRVAVEPIGQFNWSRTFIFHAKVNCAFFTFFLYAQQKRTDIFRYYPVVSRTAVFSLCNNFITFITIWNKHFKWFELNWSTLSPLIPQEKKLSHKWMDLHYHFSKCIVLSQIKGLFIE